MAGGSLLLLLDDIAAVLDDVALMTKLAAKKTAGVLGDDLAVNAEKVNGVQAERELPVVWAVAKGSFRNKCILVPSALLISAVAPVLIAPLLMLGGLYLCFEGFEKIAHSVLVTEVEDEAHHRELIEHLADPDVDIVAYERTKIRGAIRTDFILSAEIIVLTLGIVGDSEFLSQVLVLTGIAVAMTVGVYGLVAAIVKLDDAGLYLMNREQKSPAAGVGRWLGSGLVNFAPYLMKALAILGTAAMFLVGGGILVHSLHVFHELVIQLQEYLAGVSAVGQVLTALTPGIVNFLVGVAAGALVFAVVSAAQRLRGAS